MIFTVQYGTYIFPNQTFEVEELPHKMDTPMEDLRRVDGAKSLPGFLSDRKFKIKGKLFSINTGSLYSQLNILTASMHNRGNLGNLIYRSNRQTPCRLDGSGVKSMWMDGLYEHVIDVEAILSSEKPWVEDTVLETISGSRSNNSAIETIQHDGNFPTRPIFSFVAGTWSFQNDLFVRNNENSLFFNFDGPMAAGQTLVIDCDAGCVLLQDGLTMVDAMSYFSGDLFFSLEEGANDVVIDSATLSYTINFHDRYYV